MQANRNDLIDLIHQTQDDYRDASAEIERLTTTIQDLEIRQAQRMNAFAGGSAQAALKAAAMALGEDVHEDAPVAELPDDQTLALQGLKSRRQKARDALTTHSQNHSRLMSQLADFDGKQVQQEYRQARDAYVQSLAKLCEFDVSAARLGVRKYFGIAPMALSQATVPMDQDEVTKNRGGYAYEKSLAVLLEPKRRGIAGGYQKELSDLGITFNL
jgi:hypothetical protein